MAPGARRDGFAQALKGCKVSDVIAMGEIESCNIHSGIDQVAKTLHRPASRAKSADDLCAPVALRKVRTNVIQPVRSHDANENNTSKDIIFATYVIS